MKHCKGSAFLVGSVKSDPLDAWGEQSELEIEGGRLINPPPPTPSSLFQPRPKSRCKEKEETEKEDIWKAATSSLPHRLLRGLSRALCYPQAWILSGCKEREKKKKNRRGGKRKKQTNGARLHLDEPKAKINLTYKISAIGPINSLILLSYIYIYNITYPRQGANELLLQIL